MGLSDYRESAYVPYAPAVVFDAPEAAIVSIKGMEMVSASAQTCTCMVNATASLWSWGERVTISIEPSPGGSAIVVTSVAKVGTNVVNNGKHQKNAARIFAAISDVLEECRRLGQVRQGSGAFSNAPLEPYDIVEAPQGSPAVGGESAAGKAGLAPGQAATDSEELLSLLERATALRPSGALTEAEFQAMKARLLGM